MKVGIATDHGGFGLKEELSAQLRRAGHEVGDFGAHKLESDDDYPDYVAPLAKAAASGQVTRGIAICGSGVGASVCANKIPCVRASLIHDRFSARQSGHLGEGEKVKGKYNERRKRDSTGDQHDSHALH